MKLIVHGKQMRVSAAVKQFAERHALRPLRRFYDDEAAELQVEVGRENGNRGESTECHLTLYMPGTKTLHVEETLPDVYAAIELASDRMVRLAKKELEKMRPTKGGRRHKEHPLATVVAEGGVPGGLVEDRPKGRAVQRIERAGTRRKQSRVRH